MPNVIYTSWSKLEAQFELERLQGLPLQHQWLNAHNTAVQPNDIYLTTNGYDFKPGPHKKATLISESYQYLKNEYEHWAHDNKWDHRFHFNPNYSKVSKSSAHGIMTWWKRELALFEQTANNKKPEFTFGMVLSKKPLDKSKPWMFGWYRSEIVNQSHGRSFKYYGGGWSNDSNYGGEAYVAGHRGTPEKFHDARILMSKAKFVWCVENIHDNFYSLNYLTEKIWHGFLSASIPIYCGCGNVESLINPDLFIDVRKFNFNVKAILDFCEKMSDSEYQGYLNRIGDFLRGPGQKFTCEEQFLELDKKLTEVFK
jgi:hypothetical protein